jgi:hypothetical protein
MAIKKNKDQYAYWWPPMLPGTKKRCDSPIDALIDVLKNELGIHKTGNLLALLDVDSGCISRCRQGMYSGVPAFWIMKAAILSGFRYEDLCALVGEEPIIEEYVSAK